MTNPVDPYAPPRVPRTFTRKIWLSKIALAFERLWPRLWLVIGLVALFVALSLAGIWAMLPVWVHQAGVALFAIAGFVSLINAVRIPWPTRDEAIRRIERRSGVAHRPASSYEDDIAPETTKPETIALWAAHRERLARAIARLKVGRPSPRADRMDPWALRALVLMLVVPAALLIPGSIRERLMSGFDFGVSAIADQTRLDAWVAPPPYTSLPPIMLADGAIPVLSEEDARKLVEVPEASIITVRGSGYGRDDLSLEILAEGADGPTLVTPTAGKPDKTDSLRPVEVRAKLEKSARVRVLTSGSEAGRWTFAVTPDLPPKIAESQPPSRTVRGSMKLTYTTEDDYGVESAEAKVELLPEKPSDPSKAWAQPKPLSGPRLPLEPPPSLPLRLPRQGDKKAESSTLLDIGPHPWAGQRVKMWLEAKDVAGKIGRSKEKVIVLPERRFRKPLARALIEQRRKLVADSRNSERVITALDGLAIAPEDFSESMAVFLGMRTVRHRLDQEQTRPLLNESIDQLWDLALKVEDGDLSDAEKALKDAQKKLSEALERGADDQEIQDLIADLKQKLNDFLNEMQKKAEQERQENGDQANEQSQQLGQQDIEQLMQDLERNAREGSREEAERMLSELQELMDRLQTGQTQEQQADQQRAQEMMQKLNQLGDLASKQQRLMDNTFGEQRRQENGEMQEGGSQDDPNSQSGQNFEQGQGRNPQQGGRPQPGGQQPGGSRQQAEGQQGRDGQGRSQQQQRGKGDGEGSLSERQASLRQELDRLQRELEELGAGDPEKLGRAEQAMRRAEDALDQGDLAEAAQQQAEALDNMRQAAEQMAQQMQQNAQQRMGRGGDSPRDPLGRPQRAQGPDSGQSVRVPDAIDAQRAREILEELRRRAGESLRPDIELDYIDRLLRRF